MFWTVLNHGEGASGSETQADATSSGARLCLLSNPIVQEPRCRCILKAFSTAGPGGRRSWWRKNPEPPHGAEALTERAGSGPGLPLGAGGQWGSRTPAEGRVRPAAQAPCAPWGPASLGRVAVRGRPEALRWQWHFWGDQAAFVLLARPGIRGAGVRSASRPSPVWPHGPP